MILIEPKNLGSLAASPGKALTMTIEEKVEHLGELKMVGEPRGRMSKIGDLLLVHPKKKHGFWILKEEVLPTLEIRY